MRHYKKGRKLGTDASHTKAIKKSLVGALLANDRIKTSEIRAKEIRGDVDRVITWAKKGDVHSRRLAIAKVGDKEIVREIFEKVAQGLFKDRPGGYTRIMKLGPRKGDKTPMAIMELVLEPMKSAVVPAEKPVKKAATKKAAKTEAVEETVVEEVAEEVVEEVIEETPAEEAEVVEEAVEAAEEVAAEEAPAEEATK